MATIDFFPSQYNEQPEETTGPNANPTPNQFIRGSMGTIGVSGFQSTGFEDEPPLWEELGMDPGLIKQKTLAVLIPGRPLDSRLLHDTDLGGPFIFCILLGFCLLLQSGKLHFGYIFGYSVLGGIVTCLLLNLMSEHDGGVGVSHTLSVLGYCIVPLIFLALISIVFPPNGVVGFALALLSIAYCTNSASTMFVKILASGDQKYLLAYPIGLVYTCFALMVIF